MNLHPLVASISDLPTLAIFGTSIGIGELVIIGIVALLIFGKRLPEVGRNLGKGIVEFKKGLSGVENDVEKAGSGRPQQQLESTRQASVEAGRELESARAELRAAQERLKAAEQKTTHSA